MASDPCEWEIPAEHPGPDTRDATIGAVEEVEALGLDDAMSSDTAAVMIATAICKMRPLRKDIIRAAPAYSTFASCALPLRGFQRGNFVHLSAVTKRIDEFWSHSWHGPRWKVVLTVIFLNNSLAAAVISVAVALVLGVLYAGHVLPVLYDYDFWFQQLPRCGWSAYGAIVFYYVTLLAWRRRKRIFLDVLCINQESTSDKVAALLSMGAILKCSDAMLVLWDETYTKRLWCVFELAAFLKTRPAGAKRKLVIRPTIIGPCFLALTFAVQVILHSVGLVGDKSLTILLSATAAITFLGLLFCISAARSYFRSIHDLTTALRTFRLEDVRCWCCDTGHRKTEGLCDREVIQRSIISWFGSIDSFEELVRQEVLDILTDQLWRQMLSYKQCVLALVPCIVVSADIVFAEIHRASYGNAVVEVLRGFSVWLGVTPILMFLSFKLSQCLRQRCCSRLLDFLVTFFIVVVICGVLIITLMVEQLLWWYPITDFNLLGTTMIYGSCIHGIIFIGLAAACFCCLC